MKVVSDIFYTCYEENEIVVMVSDVKGKDFSIATIDVSEDIIVGKSEEAQQERLYQLAYDIAHELGYVLQGELK